MELDSRQTRRLYLAGAVAFPAPFPSAGDISIVVRSTGGQRNGADFVIVHEKSGLEQAMSRVIMKDDVAAIFFPGNWTETDQGRVFRFAERNGVRDVEKGEWYLNHEINADEISARLGIDIRSRDSGARGIVFVPEHRPVLTITECTQTAAAAGTLPADLPSYEFLGCEQP